MVIPVQIDALAAANHTRTSLVTVHETRLTEAGGYQAHITKAPMTGLIEATLRANATGQQVAALTQANIGYFFDFLYQNTFPNYRLAKSSPIWKSLYQEEDTQFSLVERNGVRRYQFMKACHCRRCGLVLPMTHVTVDHQGPQTGGEVKALVRAFRSLGLTESAGKGAKTRTFMAQHAVAAGGRITEPGPGRFSLNATGSLYLTLIYAAGIADAVYATCMNHVANLRPLCAPCNSGLGNAGYF
jgi:ribosomal protein L18